MRSHIICVLRTRDLCLNPPLLAFSLPNRVCCVCVFSILTTKWIRLNTQTCTHCAQAHENKSRPASLRYSTLTFRYVWLSVVLWNEKYIFGMNENVALQCTIRLSFDWKIVVWCVSLSDVYSPSNTTDSFASNSVRRIHARPTAMHNA